MTVYSLETRRAWNKADGSFINVIHDAIRNILLVKSTTNESAIARRVTKKRREVMSAVEQDIRISKTMLNGQNLIAALSMAGTLTLCVHGLANDRLTIGQTSTLSPSPSPSSATYAPSSGSSGPISGRSPTGRPSCRSSKSPART